MFVLLALASAGLYGAGDFIGGFTSKRASTIAVVLVSQSAGLLLIATALPLLGTPLPGRADWLWGGAAGLMGGIGVALLYRGLAVGVMAVVAPVTAVCAVVVPVAIAIAFGERPTIVAAAGIGIALFAIVLVSHHPGAPNVRTTQQRTGIPLALAAGVAIGLFFYALARTSPAAGVWPLVAARFASVTLFLAIAMGAGSVLRMPPRVAAIAAAGGVLDMLANLMYLLATREGPLTLVVTLSSLYPASTVFLARVVLHERLSARQWIGVGCALVAIVAIVAS